MEKEELKEDQIEEKQSFFIKHKKILLEILRFLLVGGLATLIEWIIAYIVVAFLPTIIVESINWNVSGTIGTTIGFMISLVFNYILSVIFVYKDKKDVNEGKSFKDFMIFFLISILVLAFQIIFIYLVNDLLFVKALSWNAILFKNLTWGYTITKVFATIVGLIANYIFRKIFIFK